MESTITVSLLLISTLIIATQSLELDRDLIRRSILDFRTKRSLVQENVHDMTSHIRVRRQTSFFPTDDEDFAIENEFSGDDAGEMSGDFGGDNEPLPPDVTPPLVPTVKAFISEWVWYRTEVNFLNSIVYSTDLRDYTSVAFHSYSDKIMFAVESYLRDHLPGYHEATPLMFNMKDDGSVHVLIDVGACSTNSVQDIEDTMRSLLRTGQIADLAVTEDDFTIRSVGTDPTRQECLAIGQVGTTSPTRTTEPTPPEFDVTPPTPVPTVSREVVRPSRRPYRCTENQATCRNGECIDRRLICDGNRDCSDGTDEPASCGNADSTKCDPTEFLCIGTGVCAQKLWRCDGDDDCGNGYDELNCPTVSPDSNCRGIEFECYADSLCVPASYQCDGENDCSDSSDERGCSAPVVITPPQKLVNAQVGETVVLDCEAAGVPSPVVSWRLNWGNVGAPPRVFMTSAGGRGKLTIQNVRESDQGAYTCEAINSEGSIFAVPDAILIVEGKDFGKDQYKCPPGQYGNTSTICRPCYCFGLTDECEPSRREYNEIDIAFTTPDDEGFMQIEPAEVEGADPTPASEPINRNQILVKPAARELQLIDLSKRFLAAAHYWSLPAQFLGAKIHSYGGTLSFKFSYNNSYNFEPKPTNHSDVIIEGANGRTLIYHDKDKHPEPKIKHSQEVSLTENDWTTPEGVQASREEMLNILNNVDKILLRTVYDNSMLSTGIGDVRMSFSTPSRSGSSGSSGATTGFDVEECICPVGYEGLSCQYCAPGYERITAGRSAGNCEIITDEPVPTLPPCGEGYTGIDCEDCAEGYHRFGGDCVRYPDTECDKAGSYGVTIGGECDCKPGCEGEKCDQCKPGHFFLSEKNADGCLSCFCMGVSRQCDSTTWNRAEIVPRYREEDRFLLTNSASTRTLQDHISFTLERRQPSVRAHLGTMPRDVYYWSLPRQFTGDKISSYGGRFQYTITYGQRDGARPISRIADVKIFGNDITLEHRSGNHPQPGNPTTFEVTLTEDNWVRPDGSAATREHLMMALADIESFIVRATYSNDMLHSMISGISLEIADLSAVGRRAFEVEECICPEGYSGLSCEDCAPGYRRSGGGLYLGTCIRCSCNGHSQSCDESTGACIQCRDNTEGDNCERCIPGFYGDPRVGNALDCHPCPCPLLPARADRPVVASCGLDIDGLPTCDACPPGYEGRQCNRCALGWTADILIPGSPCRQVGSDCKCDPNGSVDGTCDADGRCNCKESVEGEKCDACKPSYFYFSVENENGGCLPCFCMGVTRNCESSNYVRDKITADFSSDFGGFALTNRRRSQRVTSGLQARARGTVLTRPGMSELPIGTYYWQLPDEFLGDKIVSYGGELSYTVSYMPFASGAATRDHDVIIIGNDIMLVASIGGDVEPREQTERSVVFKEKYWRRADGQPATREHLLMALADLEDILIRASYSTSMQESTLSRLSMETASVNEFDGADMAYEVEHCTCPDGYEGLSCEDCSPGFTRSGGGLYLGLCQPCRCNGHADVCDPETGECVDCRDNTIGANCDQCAPGFYTMSSDPAETYCQQCACPGQGDDSFSDTCEYVRETRNLVCTSCQEGYEGTRCENCAEGYEGNPRINGGRCSRVGTPGGITQAPPEVTVTPSSLNVAEGKPVTIRCIVKSSPPVRVMWRRTGSAAGRAVPESAIVSDRDYSLTIARFSRDDAGTYECIAQNQGGVDTDQAVLTVARPRPMIQVRVEEPTNKRLRTGNDVTFVCTASSKMPGYIIYWSKQGGRLPNRATDFNGILHISDLTASDSGAYVCTGSNMYEIDTATAILTVVGDSDAVRPTVTIEPARQVIREGGEAVFRCSAAGTPPIKIEWRPSSGESMPETARIIDGELYIPSVDMDHSAVFYCRASNPQGVAEATALLDVTAVGSPPTVTVVTATKEIKSEGDNVEMRCVAKGLPRPLFSWRRLGLPGLPVNAEPRGGTLQLMNINVNNQDTYICTARNTFGEDSGQIEVEITASQTIQKPICKTDPESLTAYVGAEASITCVAEGDPLPTITWVRADGMRLQSNAEVKGNKLIIHDVTTYNAGRYVCIATNAGGTTRSEMTLKVENKQLPRVEILPRNQQIVEVGESASFTCKPVSGHPVEVTWSRTDRKPFTSRTKLEDGGVIKFTDVTPEESGSYICIATNVVGFREVATLLNVIRKPTLTVEPSTEVYLKEGTSVTLRCNADGIPAPNVVWKKVSAFGQLMAITPYKRHFNELRLANVQLSNSAQYRCIAVSAAGDAELRVTVTVGEKEAIVEPEVTVEKRVVSSVLGARVQLRCAASGQPKPDIVWSRKYGRLPTGATQVDGVLTIPRANQRDVGVYICTAGNPGGTSSAESSLKIIVAPRLRITPSGPVLRISNGQSAVITCSAVEGSIPITYQFNKVSGSMSNNILTSGGRMQILSFNEETDSGRYTCVGKNEAGTATTDVTLLPLDLPSVTVSPREVTVASGSFVRLECTADNDGAEITWVRSDNTALDTSRVSQANGILRIENTVPSDDGEYKCTVTNNAGTSSQTAVVSIQGPPKAKLTSSAGDDQVFYVGDQVELTCTATGHPTPDLKITKDGVEALLADEGQLIINHLFSSDSGTYACVATNVAGSDEDTYVITVEDSRTLSIIPDQELLEVRSGDELAISCVVTGTELPVTWSRKGGDLPSTAVVAGNVVQIDKILVEDAGTYVCTEKALEKSIDVAVHAFIPYFTQSPLSYISLKENADFYRSLRITVSFRPNSGSGLILYSYGSAGDFLSLALFDNGKVEFRYNVGSGDAVITSLYRVELSEWHTVTISRHGREGQLVVDDGEPVRGTSEGSFRSLDLNHPLYVGGYPSGGDSLPSSLGFLGFDVGFYGCISQLIIGDDTIDLGSSPLVNEKVGIVRCKTCGLDEDDSPCQHQSSCLETHSNPKGYMCGCSSDYVGPECQFRKEDICGDLDACGLYGSCTPDYERELGYRCECQSGYAGPKCQFKAQKDISPNPFDPGHDDDDVLEATPSSGDPAPTESLVETPRILSSSDLYGAPTTALSDNDFDGITLGSGVFGEKIEEATSFGKESYMQMDVSHRNRRQFDATLMIKLRSLDDGLILYNSGVLGGRKRAVEGGDIFVSLAILDGFLEFRYNCGSGLAVLKSNDPVLILGEWHTIHANRANRKGLLEVDGVVVAEGQSPRGGRSADLNGPLYVGGVNFWDRVPEQVGVRDGFEGCIDQVRIDGKRASLNSAVSSKNVDKCYVQTSTASVTDPATTLGTTSEAVTTTPVPEEDDYEDLGPLFLDSGRPVVNPNQPLSGTTARFSGDSYAAFSANSFPHNLVAEQFSLYFKSTDPDGLILVHGRANSRPAGGDFIMLGLRNARLQYSFLLGTSQGKAMGSFPVADGQWHRVTVVRRASLAFMWIDDLPRPVAIQAQGVPSHIIRLGDVYIGGATDVPMYTGERFKRGFRGCIRDVRFMSMDQERAMQIGATYLPDSDIAPLLFGELEGRRSAKDVTKCRPDKTRKPGNGLH